MADISSTSDTAGNDEIRDVSDVTDDESVQVSILEERISSSSSRTRETGLDRASRDDESSTREAPGSDGESVCTDFAIHDLCLIMVPGLRNQRDRDLDQQSIYWIMSGKLWEGGSWYTYVPSTIVGETASSSSIYDNARKLLDHIVAVCAHYGTPLLQSLSLAPIIKRDEALHRRSLVLIAHDLGGSIVKQALIIASEAEAYADVIAKIALLIFLGTPHRTSTSDSWERILSKIVFGSLSEIPGTWFPEYIEKCAKYHEDLSENFVSIVENYRILNCYEIPDSSKKSTALVEEYVATLGVPWEEIIGLKKKNHDSLLQAPTQEQKDFILDRIIDAYMGLDAEYLECLRKLCPNFGKVKMFRQTMNGVQPSLDWITSHPSYKSWNRADPPGALILRKKQGLDLEALHESLLRLLKAKLALPQAVTASFLFDSQDRRRNTRSALFASVSAQILYKRPCLFLKLRHLYRALMKNPNWTGQQLWIFFRALLCRTNDQVILVVDGLQECDESRRAYPEDLPTSLRAMVGRIQVIMSYEGEKTLINDPSNVIFEIDLDGLDKPANSKGYLEEVMDFAFEKHTALGEFKREIVGKLDDPTATYSVWAKAYLNFLEASRIPSTPSAFHEELKTLSLCEPHSEIFSKPNKTHLRKLWRPSKDRLSWAERALAWVSCSCRRLKLRELATALAIDSDVSFDDEVARDVAADLRQSLAGLVEIAGDEVSIVHSSVRDLENHKTHNTVERISPRLEAHLLIYQECRSYLIRMNQAYEASKSEYRDESSKELDSGDTIRDDLLDYATEYWHVHYRLAEISGTDYHDVIELLNNSQHLPMWRDERLNCVFRELSAEYTLDHLRDSLLCRCSYLGLSSIIKSLIGPPTQLEEADLMASLLSAVWMGHTDVVNEIIQHGSLRQSEVETALLRALEFGHGKIFQILVGFTSDGFIWDKVASLFSHATVHCDTEAVKCLLDRCKNKTELKRYLVTPLHMACEYGYSSIVELLLTTGCIEIDEPNTEGKTGLHLAAENGHPAVIQLLLSHNPVVNFATSGELETPLHLASKYGHAQAAELLLSHGADTDLKTSDGRVALHFVGFGGSYAVAKVLLEEEAHINAQDNEKESVLHVAIRNGHKKLLKFLLDYSDLRAKAEQPAEPAHPRETDSLQPFRLDLNLVDNSGRTPLMNALDRGLEEIALRLVENGASLEAKDHIGRTAITIASRRGYTTVVETLLARKVDTNGVDCDSQTPLHVASREGHYQIVRLLLDSGADVCTKDSAGRTPMSWACLNDHVEIVQELLKKAPDLHSVGDVRPWIPLNDVVKSGSKEMLDVLLHYAGTNASKFFGDSLQESVLEAVLQGNEGVLGLLLDAGADIDGQDQFGNTALQLAASCSHSRTVLLLLARRADLELRDDNGDTALSDAARAGSTVTLKLLMDAGATKDTRNNLGFTPLLRAAEAGYDQIVRLLLERGAEATSAHPDYGDLLQLSAAKYSAAVVKVLLVDGADINSANRSQGSILQIAIANDRRDTVDLLLDEKVDINQICPSRGTALQVAIESRSLDVVKLLLAHGAAVNEGAGRFDSALHTMVHYWHDDQGIFQLLLEHGAEIGKPDSQGRLPVHLAAYEDCLPLVTSWNANASCKDRQGRVPLHFAAASGALSVLRYLLDFGKDCNVTDDDGWTPLHWACRQARPRVIQVLLDHGANVFAEDIKDRWTPMDVAVFHDNIDVLKCLAEPSEVKKDDRRIVESAGTFKAAYCDSCFCDIMGDQWRCDSEDCYDFDYCFKCYWTVGKTHNATHTFSCF